MNLGNLPTALAPGTRVVGAGASPRDAEKIFRRYQRMFIGAQVVQAILELNETHARDPADSVLGRFRRRRREWESQGGFLETVTAEDIATWISSDSYIVTEASDPDALRHGTFVPVAQCMYRLPAHEDDWVIPLLAEPPDEIYYPALYRTILRDGPRASALVDYLGVLPGWVHRGCAGAARYAGMLEVIRRNAACADAHRIRHVVGLTFVIRGVVVPGTTGTEPDAVLRLDRDFGQDEVVNRASERAITTSRRCPSQVLGQWRGAPAVPVTVGGRTYLLRVHWYCHVRAVSDVLDSVTP